MKSGALISLAAVGIGGAVMISQNQDLQEKIKALGSQMGGAGGGINLQMPEINIPMIIPQSAQTSGADQGLLNALGDLFSGAREKTEDVINKVKDTVKDPIGLDGATEGVRDTLGKYHEFSALTTELATTKAKTDTINWFLNTKVGKGLYTLGDFEISSYHRVKDTGANVVEKAKTVTNSITGMVTKAAPKSSGSSGGHKIIVGKNESAGSIVNRINQSIGIQQQKQKDAYNAIGFPKAPAIITGEIM